MQRVHVTALHMIAEVKSHGMEFELTDSDDGTLTGHFYVMMTGIIWCQGKTPKAKGVKIRWEHLSRIMNSKRSVEVALKAARS